jgi:inhibitor of KinA
MIISPLGDQGVLARFASEAEALGFATAVRTAGLPEVVDVVAAYSTVAVFHNPAISRVAELADRLKKLKARRMPKANSGRRHLIPCCYEFASDLPRIVKHTRLSPDQVIKIHSHQEYTVYAIGFCPGFPYLGYLPDALCGVPRLPSPRLRVEPGSVGLTGRQTGIYPLERPGGWNLLGRTPLELVNVADDYFPLRTGDRVKFEPIDAAEFERLHGKRLSGEPAA